MLAAVAWRFYCLLIGFEFVVLCVGMCLDLSLVLVVGLLGFVGLVGWFWMLLGCLVDCV